MIWVLLMLNYHQIIMEVSDFECKQNPTLLKVGFLLFKYFN